MLDNELAEIVDNLRALGSDVADVEVKRAAEALPRTVRETLSAFANTGGGNPHPRPGGNERVQRDWRQQPREDGC